MKLVQRHTYGSRKPSSTAGETSASDPQSFSYLPAFRVPYQKGSFRYLDAEACPWATISDTRRRARRSLHLSRFDRSPAILGSAESANVVHCQGVGYRTVLASDGLTIVSASRGWYWEVAWRGKYLRLGVAHLGIALYGPLGTDSRGWAICSRDGGTFHGGIRNVGCEPFTEDDIIGCWLMDASDPVSRNSQPYITMPRRKLVSYYGVYFEEHIDNPSISRDTTALIGEGSANSHPVLKIYKNGRQIQEISLSPSPSSLLEYYYPAFSLYPGTSVEVNWGPIFVCPPDHCSSPPPSAAVQRDTLIKENLFDLSIASLCEKGRENNKL